MSLLKWIFYGGVLLQIATATALADTPDKVLRVYGPGGPHQVLQECADLYLERTGVDVAIIKALPYDLERKLPEDGDIYYGGAEYMLEDFNRKNPGVLNMNSSEKLHARRIGIIVRKGNPLNINGVNCLSREEVDLLDVKLERMRLLYTDPSGGLRNVSRLEYTGRQGLSAWISSANLDILPASSMDSSSSIRFSGCHCTPTANGWPVTSTASINPSGATPCASGRTCRAGR